MKFFASIVGGALILIFVSPLSGQRLYTWTDENGVMHITQHPPPQNVTVEDVMTYREKTPAELEEIQRQREGLHQELERLDKIERAQQAAVAARESEEKAAKALEQAEDEFESKREYIRRLTSTKDKRKQFRSKVQRLKQEAEASLSEAQAAQKKAEEAAEKARVAAEEATAVPSGE